MGEASVWIHEQTMGKNTTTTFSGDTEYEIGHTMDVTSTTQNLGDRMGIMDATQ
jgi:hypothetical protein